MMFIDKILNFFGYYKLRPNKFYSTDQKGIPHQCYCKIGDDFYSGIHHL